MSTETPDVYLVQGFYFQERESFGVEIVAIDGAIPVIREEMVRCMFAGVIWWDEEIGMWLGNLLDSIGPSELEDIDVGGPVLYFEKNYTDGISGCITYQFTQAPGGFWVGGYTGERVGSGDANCVLIPLPKGMLEFPQD